MSSLPNPNEFTNYKAKLSPVERSQTGSKGYDLVQMDKNFKVALKEVEAHIKRGLSNELISYSFWKSAPNYEIGKYFGYSRKYNSLTVHLYNDAGEIETIAIRNADGTKWKTFGSKKFTPYTIKDDVIFVSSGMAEIVICDLLNLSFIGIQSDGMVQHLPQELKELARDKFIVILSDNDDSFKKIIPTIKEFFTQSQTIVIDFEKMMNQELPKGYDFRDFVNKIEDAQTVLAFIEREIMKGGSNV